jgi:hypothetical protein
VARTAACVVVVGALAACGAPPQPGATSALPASDPPFVPHERSGSLERADLPAGTPGTAAAVLEPAREPARQVALAFARALLRADAVGLQQVLAELIAYGPEDAPRPRADLVERCVRETRSLTHAPEVPLERVIDLDAIEVRRAGTGDLRVPLPPGIQPSDLIVSLPPHIAAPGNPLRVPCLGSVYVRVGEPTRIVGLMR